MFVHSPTEAVELVVGVAVNEVKATVQRVDSQVDNLEKKNKSISDGVTMSNR